MEKGAALSAAFLLRTTRCACALIADRFCLHLSPIRQRILRVNWECGGVWWRGHSRCLAVGYALGGCRVFCGISQYARGWRPLYVAFCLDEWALTSRLVELLRWGHFPQLSSRYSSEGISCWLSRSFNSSEVCTPSFLKMEYLCALAVEGDMPSALAM